MNDFRQEFIALNANLIRIDINVNGFAYVYFYGPNGIQDPPKRLPPNLTKHILRHLLINEEKRGQI